MRVTIELDETNPTDVARLAQLFGAGAEPAAKPRKVKATEPVAGNPDGEAGHVPNPAKSPELAANPGNVTTLVQPAAAASAIVLKADAPAEIVALSQKPEDKETLGKAILKCSKPVAEGGRTRPVAVAILEKFRPAGFTEPLVKVGIIDKKQYAALAQLILAEYR